MIVFVIEFIAMFNDLSVAHKGMILALVGFTSYAFSDICAKWLTQEFSIYQVLFQNNLCASVVLLLAAPKLGGLKSLTTLKFKRLHLLRGVLNAAISFMIMKAFLTLPIADIYTFIFAMPFYAGVLAIFLYGEHVSRNRWIAIIVGFIGVVIALQPGVVTFNPDLLWAMGCGIVIAVMFTISKSLQGESLLALGFWPLIMNVIVGGLLCLTIEYETVSVPYVLLSIMNGVFIAMGILFVSNAFRIAPASAVSPFLYTEMIWAILFGYLIFGDVPGAMMLLGASVIILSGLYLLVTERRKKAKSILEN
jgi:drug/metabolite transporter (DMT)-like permease